MNDQDAKQEIHKWREVWRENRHDVTDPDGYYSDKAFVCDELQAMKIERSGFVVSRSFADWHRLAAPDYARNFKPQS